MPYLNNIIIYLNSKEEHKKHIKWVLKRLHKKICLLQLRNVSSILKKTNFIGFIIKLGQISIDLKKIQAIVD